MKLIQIIVIIIIVFVVSAGLSVGFFSLANPQSNTKKVNFDDAYSFDASDLSDFRLDVIDGSVEIIEGNQTNITIHHSGYCEYLRFGKHEEKEIKFPRLEVKKFGSLLETQIKDQDIDFNWDIKTIYVNCDQDFEIIIPLNHTITTLEVDGVSAKIDIDVHGLKDITLNSISGNVEVKNTVEVLTVDTISGHVRVAGGNIVNVDSTSGNMFISSVKEASIDTISGNVHLDLDDDQSIYFDTVSGNLRGNVQERTDALIVVDTVSGNLIVE